MPVGRRRIEGLDGNPHNARGAMRYN